MKTFGEFFDSVDHWAHEESLCVEAIIFMEKWKGYVSPGDWEKLRALELDDDIFYDFVAEMTRDFNLRLEGIAHYAIQHSNTKERAQEFFRILALKGREFGLEVDEARVKL